MTPWDHHEVSALFRALAEKHKQDGKCSPCIWYLPATGCLEVHDVYPWSSTIFPGGHKILKIQRPCAFSHMVAIVKAPFN